MHRPQDMGDHKHEALLNEIIEAILASPEPVHLWKVKSHIGVVGNEIADNIAKGVAKGEIDMEDCIEYSEPSNNRHLIYWPHEVTEAPAPPRTHTVPPPVQQAADPAAAPRKRKRPLENLGKDLKRRSHEKCKFGKANRETIYFEAWHRTAPQRVAKASNKFLTDNKISFGERKAALAYRYGCLYNQKLAMRYGHATSDRCLLCGEPDGGHHTASGCAKLKGMYIDRHNRIGRILLREIARGRKGGFLVQLDLGSPEKLTPEELPAMPRTIVVYPSRGPAREYAPTGESSP